MFPVFVAGVLFPKLLLPLVQKLHTESSYYVCVGAQKTLSWKTEVSSPKNGQYGLLPSSATYATSIYTHVSVFLSQGRFAIKCRLITHLTDLKAQFLAPIKFRIRGPIRSFIAGVFFSSFLAFNVSFLEHVIPFPDWQWE